MRRPIEPLADRNIVSGISAKKRRTPLVRDLTYYQEQKLNQSPRFTQVDDSKLKHNNTETLTITNSQKHSAQLMGSTIQLTQQQLKLQSAYKCTHARKNQLEELLSATTMSQLNVSSLAESLWRVLSPNDKVVRVKLSEVATIFDIIAEQVTNKPRCLQHLKSSVESYLKSQKVTYNKLTLHSHLNELYEFIVKISEPGLGVLRYKFKHYLDSNKENHNGHRSLTKCEELFEQSKSRSRRKQQRQHQRLLKEICAGNHGQRTTTYQETLRLFHNTLYTSKQSEDRNKSSRKATNKTSNQPRPTKYSKLHADKLSARSQHHQKSSVLFELNIRIDGEVANVQIRAGESPLEVVEKLRGEFELSKNLQLQLTSMIQQYLDEHLAAEPQC